MNHDDTTPPPVSRASPSASCGAWSCRHPPRTTPDKRIDVIHEPDLDLLWGGQE